MNYLKSFRFKILGVGSATARPTLYTFIYTLSCVLDPVGIIFINMPRILAIVNHSSTIFGYWPCKTLSNPKSIVNAQKREISVGNITLIGIYMVINRFTQLLGLHNYLILCNRETLESFLFYVHISTFRNLPM